MKYYRIYYGIAYLCIMCAESKHEAIERVLSKHSDKERKFLKAVRLR